jgi:hypothetical protein
LGGRKYEEQVMRSLVREIILIAAGISKEWMCRAGLLLIWKDPRNKILIDIIYGWKKSRCVFGREEGIESRSQSVVVGSLNKFRDSI